MEEVFTWLTIVQKLNKHIRNFKNSNAFELGSTHMCLSGNLGCTVHFLEEPYLGILASGRTDL